MGLYKLTLDDEMDKDIIDYIDSFPRMRKSEMVRQAIREHMARVEGGQQVVIPTPPSPPVTPKASVIPKTNNSMPITSKEVKVDSDEPPQQQKNRYSGSVDALGILEEEERPVDLSGVLAR